MPAAAVIREGQALFKITGRKAFVDCNVSYLLNFRFFETTFNTALLEFEIEKWNFTCKGNIL